MKKHNFLFILSATQLIMGNTLAQKVLTHQSVFPNAVSIHYALGNYSVRDEVISKNIYSGTLPYFSADWSRYHEKYGHRLSLEFRRSEDISNNSIPTEITQFSIRRSYLYPVSKHSLLAQDIFTYLGPCTEFFMHYNQPRLKGDGLFFDISFVALLSLGIDSEVIFRLIDNFNAEGAIRLSLLSFGAQMPSVEGEDVDETTAGIVTLFTGTNMAIDLGLRYQPLRSVTMKLGYKFQLTRLTPWRFFLAVSDNLSISFSYNLDGFGWSL